MIKNPSKEIKNSCETVNITSDSFETVSLVKSISCLVVNGSNEEDVFVESHSFFLDFVDEHFS